MDRATRSVQKFAGEVETAGRRLSIGITLPLAGAGLAAIKAAGEMEQASVGFTTLLKSADAAKAHLEELKKFAVVTPFQFEDLTKASRLMQAYGFAAQEVVPKLRTIGNAVSALGGGSDLLERVVRSIGEIGTRGKITGEQLRELSRAGIPALEAIAKKMGVSVADAQKQVTAGAVDAKTALDGLLEYMDTRFKGGMEAQSKTVLGAWSNIKDKLTFTLADIGNAILPWAKSFVNDTLDPMLTKIRDLATEFGKLPKPVQNATLASAGLLAALPLVTVALGATISNAVIIAGAFGKVGSVAIALAASLGGQLAAALGTATAGVGALGLAAGAATATLAVLAGVGIWKVVEAAIALRNAESQLAESQAQTPKLLQELEVRLVQHGANIDDLKKKYSSGVISAQEYSRALFDLAKQYASTTQAGKAHADNVMDTAKAFEILGIKSTAERKKELADALSAYQAIKAAGSENGIVLADAADKVKKAQEALNGVLDKTVDKFRAISFAERSLQNALIMQAGQEASRQQQEIVKWLSDFQKNGTPAFPNLPQMTGLPSSEDMDEFTKNLEKVGVDLRPIVPDAERFNAALQAFGLAGERANIPAMEQHFSDLGEALNIGAVDVDTYLKAWIRLMHAYDAAGKPLDETTKKEVIELEKQYGGQISQTRKEANAFEREMTQAFHSVSRGIASSIVNFKGWGETFKSIAKDTAQNILTIFIEGLFKKLAKELADLLANAKGVLGKIGAWLGGIAGGGSSAAGSAGSAAGSAGSAGSSAGGAVSSAASGVMGTIGAVGAAVGAVSSVIGNFQMAGMNKSLDVLVNHTLRLYNELYNFRMDAWTREQHWYVRTGEMWQSILDIKDLIGRGGVGTGSGKGGVTLNNCTFNGMNPQQVAQAIFDQAALAGAL